MEILLWTLGLSVIGFVFYQMIFGGAKTPQKDVPPLYSPNSGQEMEDILPHGHRKK